MAKSYYSSGFIPRDVSDDNADVKRSARSQASESASSNLTYYSAVSSGGGHGQNFEGTSMNIKNQLPSVYADKKFNKLPVNNQRRLYNGDFNYSKYNNTSNRCEDSDSDTVTDDDVDDDIYNVEYKNKNLTHRVSKKTRGNHNDYLTYDAEEEEEEDEEEEEEEEKKNIISTAGSVGSSINTFLSAESVVGDSSARFAVAVNGKPPSYYNNKAQVPSLMIPTNYNGHVNRCNDVNNTNLCQQNMQYIPINNSDRDRYKIPNNVQYYEPDKYVEEAPKIATSKRNGKFSLPTANGTETAVNFLTQNASEFKMPADNLSNNFRSANKRMANKGNTNYYKKLDKCSDEGFSSRSESSFDDNNAKNGTIINNKLSSGRSSNSSGLGEEYNDTIDKQNAPIFHSKEKFRKNSQKEMYDMNNDNASVCDSGVSSENLDSRISSVYHSLPYSGDESTARSHDISTVYGSIKSVAQPHINVARTHKKDNRRSTASGNSLKQINVKDDDLVNVLSNTGTILTARSDTLSTDTNISEMDSVATSGNTCFYSIPNSQSASNTARTFRTEGEHLKYIPMSIEKLDKTKSTESLANRKIGENENDSGEESTRSLSNSVNSSLATFFSANLSLGSSVPQSDRSNSTSSYETCGMRTYYSALNYKLNTETESEDLESTDDAEGDLKSPLNTETKTNAKKKTVSYYKWSQQKKRQKERNEMRQEKLEAARLEQEEEQRKISEMAVENWMKKKQAEEMNKLKLIGNKQMEDASTLRAENSKKNLLEDERRKKFDEWVKKKKIQEDKQRAIKKKQEERKKLAEIKRREESENAFNIWVTKSAGRPKPVPSSQGLDSLRGTMAPIFVNKNEWVAA